MKKRLFLGAVLLSILAVSCSKEQRLNNGNETETGKSISLLAEISNGISTRLTCEDDITNKVLKFNWSDNESFKLYKGAAGSANEFTKTAKGNIFTGTIPGGGSDTYYAVYGNNITNNNGELNINISSQKGVASAENGIATFMLAQAKYLTQASGMTPTLDFQHKLGVMKLTLTLPDGVTGKVSKVTIRGLHNKASYTLSDASYAYADDDKGDITATNGTTGFSYSSDKKITAYVGVFPEKVAANQVTISVKVDNYNYDYTIAEAKTLAACKVVPVSATIKTNFKSVYNKEDYKTWSEDNCGSAPTYNDMCKYLGAGVYWDNGSTSGDGYYDGNVQTYTLPNGKTYHAGLWMMKKAYIGSEVTGTNSVSLYFETMKSGRPSAEEIGKYFFLPALGLYYYNSFSNAGSHGFYWLSSPYGNAKAYYMFFYDGFARVNYDDRVRGCLPLIAE